MPQWLSWICGGFTHSWYAITRHGNPPLYIVERDKTVIAVQGNFEKARAFSRVGDCIYEMRLERYWVVEEPPKYEQRVYREVRWK